jgi:hypothetical protein
LQKTILRKKELESDDELNEGNKRYILQLKPTEKHNLAMMNLLLQSDAIKDAKGFGF